MWGLMLLYDVDNRVRIAANHAGCCYERLHTGRDESPTGSPSLTVGALSGRAMENQSDTGDFREWPASAWAPARFSRLGCDRNRKFFIVFIFKILTEKLAFGRTISGFDFLW